MKPQKWALVTGAASGIGAELCGLFARDGVSLVLVDKNQLGLETASQKLAFDFGIEAIPLTFDLSDPESPARIFAALEARGIKIDVLVNNAGFGTFGDFWESDIARETALFHVNILAPMLLTRLFLPGMVKRKRGQILNIGSISGFLASPHASTYYASKAWLLAFSQGVSASLRNTGVSATIVCPGPTYTAFDWHSTGDGDAPPARKKFQMDAAEVARQAYRGLGRRQMVVIPGASNRFLALLAKILPRHLALWLVNLGQNRAN